MAESKLLCIGFSLLLCSCMQGERRAGVSTDDVATPSDALVVTPDPGVSPPADVGAASDEGLTPDLWTPPPPKPCIEVTPEPVNFGGKLLFTKATIEVTISSCGDVPLEVRSVRLIDQEEMPNRALSDDFELELDGLPETLGDAPAVIPPGGAVTFLTSFFPEEINPKDENGKPIPDTGFIRILSDAETPELLIETRGFGVDIGAPVAVIMVLEGEEVAPLTTLHLVGSNSYTPTGPPIKYAWSVEQPAGSQSVFIPSAAAADPTFQVNVAGTYVFRLLVWDANSVESFIYAEYQVTVLPTAALHVELTWHTPLDSDETDEGPEAGADLDLHLVHPAACGLDIDSDGVDDGWFDEPFDCFWFNPQPDWGSPDPAVDDDPSLALEDADGAGPEVLVMHAPEAGLAYKVGVNYWDSHGFGSSFATVRVFAQSVLVYEMTGVELAHQELWQVATIDPSSGEVWPFFDDAGGPLVLPELSVPLVLTELPSCD